MKYRGQSNTFQSEANVFSEGGQGNIKTYHEVLLLMKFLQTRPQAKSMNIIRIH